MEQNFKTKYWVSNVPRSLYLPYIFYSYTLAALLYFYFLILRLTTHIERSGDLKKISEQHTIHCLWHQFSFLYMFVVFDFRSYVLMAHPYWYMKPVHLFFEWRGMKKIVLGSAGTHGREAANEVVELLKKGNSTLMALDGPQGPPRILKKGALYMALQSEVPLLPLRFQCKRFFKLKGWDQKIIPLPFAKIQVEIGKNIIVTSENFAEAEKELMQALKQ